MSALIKSLFSRTINRNSGKEKSLFHRIFHCYLLSLFLILNCTTLICKPVIAAELPVQLWLTTPDQKNLLKKQKNRAFDQRGPSENNIVVDASQTYQTMQGFGAAVTDASAILLQQHLSKNKRQQLLTELFGRGIGGVGFDMTRITIGASDFSPTHYSFDDVALGESDNALEHFSIDMHRSSVLPVLKQIKEINPELLIVASPWSAPAWMKTSQSLYQGTLKPELYDVYARFFMRFLQSYATEGVPIFALTIQNEPHFEPTNYPGMRFAPEARADFIGHHLGPMLKAAHSSTKIMDWDHNWDNPQSPLTVLSDPVAYPYIDGVAWHCYAGDVAVQSVVHDAFPDKDAWLTECSGGLWDAKWENALTSLVNNLIIGSTRHWAKGVLMWNLVLDQNHGPHLGGCANCRAMVTVNTDTGKIQRNVEYYAFAHASRFVRPGAKRIASDSNINGLETVAFQNQDDASYVLVVSNSSTQSRVFTVQFEGKFFTYTIPVASVITAVWKQSR